MAAHAVIDLDARYAALPPLWPHQAEVVPYLVYGSFGLLWDMRSGKTRPCGEAARVLAAVGEIDSILVLPPVNAKHLWLRELETMLPAWSVHVCEGLRGEAVTAEAVVANPDILAPQRRGADSYAGWLQSLLDWTEGRRFALIVDEAHLCLLHPSSARYGAIRLLSRLAARTWLLTGTPMEKSAMDIFWMLKHLGPGFPYAWSSPDSFGKRYANATWNAWKGGYTGEKRRTRAGREYLVARGGNDYSGIRNEVQLWQELRLCAHRFRREGELSNRCEVWVDTKDQQVQAHTDRLPELRAQLVSLKVARVAEHVGELLDRNEWPVLVWGHSVEFTESLARRLQAPLIRGGVDWRERERIRTGGHRVVVLNIRAGGTAMDWSFCRRAVFGEIDWHAGNLRQAEARVHDPEGRREPAVIEYLLVRHSVDEYIWDTVLAKGQAIDRLDQAADQLRDLALEELIG